MALNMMKDNFELLVKNIKKDDGELLFAGLYGSQNYGLETKDSDIDIKAIYLLDLNSLIERREISRHTEHIVYKDLYSFIKCLKKPNINFLEILFSDYISINPNYRYWVERLLSRREDIARIDEIRLLKSIYGMSESKMKLINRDCDTNKLGKHVYYLMFLHNFVESFFINKKTFKESLASEDIYSREEILSIKKSEEVGLYYAKQCYLLLNQKIKYIEENKLADSTDLEVSTFLDNMLGDIYRERLRYTLEWNI